MAVKNPLCLYNGKKKELQSGDTLPGGGGGANTALSNLASVAINESLISDADKTDDLGSASKAWKEVFAYDQALKAWTDKDWTILNHFLMEWDLLDSSTSDSQDRFGNVALALAGSPTKSSDSYGGYMTFDGSTQYAYISDNVFNELGTGMGYLIFMFNVTSLAAIRGLFAKNIVPSVTGNRFNFYINTNGSLQLLYGTSGSLTSTAGDVSTGTLYFCAVCRSTDGDGHDNWNIYLQPITDSSFNSTPKASVDTGASPTSCGANTDWFVYGDSYDSGNTERKFYGKIYRCLFCKGESISLTQLEAVFLEYKNASYKHRGMDLYGYPNFPATVANFRKIFVADDCSVIARCSTGIDDLASYPKFKTEGRAGTMSLNTGSLYFTKHIVQRTGIVKRLFFELTASAPYDKCVAGIYSNDPVVQFGRPKTKLAQTTEYYFKESDEGMPHMMDLTSPLFLEEGTIIWVGITTSANTTAANERAASGVRFSGYVSFAYNKTLPATNSSSLSSAGTQICSGI